MAPSEARQLEKAILRLPDVEGVAVVMGGQRDVEEIHILASGGVPPKVLVRQVEQTAEHVLAHKVDYRTISLVRLGRKKPLLSGPRPHLARLQVAGGEAQVVLQEGTRRWLGTAETREPPQPREAAEAAVRAVAQILGGPYRLSVAEIMEVEVSGLPVLLVLLSLEHGGAEELLLGAALIRESPLSSAARAVLDATNRRLEQLL